MNTGNRHFAKFIANGEEVVIIGYRKKLNEVLVCFLSALSQQDAQALRCIVQSNDAQHKDFLMDVVGGSVLQAAHHVSGTDWQTYLIRQAVGRGKAVRRVTMKELEFFDQTQKSYFGGYGPSIEPEVDKLRKSRIEHQDAAMAGRPLPEPDFQQTIPARPAVESAPAPDINAALLAVLAGIQQSNQAILTKLADMSPTPVRAKPGRKPKVDAPTKVAAVSATN